MAIRGVNSMKRKVYTDGNGSKHILVEGLGEYSPKADHDHLAKENDQLKADNAELVELVKLSCDRLDMLDSWIESQRSYAEWVNMDELEKRLAKSTSHLYKLIQKHKEPNNA